MVNWFSIAANILSFMEDLRLEELVQRLFQDHKFNKYFGEEEEKILMNNKDSTKHAHFIQEKKDRILDFFEMEQMQKNIKNIYVLSEMLLLDNIELKGKIVDLIYKQFSSKKRYFECLNNVITIDFNNERIYHTLNELYYIIHFGLVDLQFQKSTEINKSQSNLQKMNESFCDLIEFLYDENPPDDLVELGSSDIEDGEVFANVVKPSIETNQRAKGMFPTSTKKKTTVKINGSTIQDFDSHSNHINQVNIELNLIHDNLKAPEILETLVPSNLASHNRLDNGQDPTVNIIPKLNKNKSSNQNSPNLIPQISTTPLMNATSNMKKSELKSVNDSKDHKNISINDKSSFKNDSNIMYSILDQHYIEIHSLHTNQRLLKNMNYHKLFIQVLLIFGQKNLDKDQDYTKQKNTIVRNCLLALIYFTLQNEENQDIILQYPDYPEVIKSIFSLKNVEGMLELTFIFVSQIYKDNYSILLSLGSHFSKQGRFVLKSLFVNFFDQASKPDRSYCIYFIQFLKYFFTINGKSIGQNQTLIFKIFSDETISSKSQIQQIITRAIKYCCIEHENPMTKMQNLSPTEQIKEEDYIIKIPQEAILIQQMLITFRELAKGSGLAVNTFVRIFFSLQDIKTLLRYSSWNPSLKKEALDYLVEVYLNSKNIEPNEFREIQIIIKEILYQDLIDYIKFTKQHVLNRNNQKWKCKADSLNLFEGRNPYGSIRYLVQMNYLYGLEYYILNSIVPCLQSFFSKLPDIPSDHQYQLATQIESLCRKLEIFWDKEDQHWRKMLEGDYENEIEEIEDTVYALKEQDDEESKDNTNNNQKSSQGKEGGIIWQLGFFNKDDSDKQGTIRAKSITRKKYSKKVSGTTLQKKQKKTDMIKGTQIVLGNLQVTDKFKDIQMKQQNILTHYNYESAFALARQNRPLPFFQKVFIDQEHEQELDNLISTLIEIKIQDQSKFRTIIQSFIAVLSCDTIETDIRMNSMKILRKISNYKQDSKVNESIQHDLISMGFLNFLCDIIIIEQDPLMKLEYIRGLIDFMEESNRDIQDSFYQYLLNDKDNRFLVELNSFLQSNYHSTKSNQGLFDEKGQHQQHFKRILILKFEICMRTLELLRLSAENHYRPMQDFLRYKKIQKIMKEIQEIFFQFILNQLFQIFREQTNPNGDKKVNNINMIHELADMFERYKKVIQDDDLQMGIKILDTLIEWIQGPCEENQLALCHTNILENLEDMQYDISQRSKKRGKYQKYRSEFNQKTILILRSLFEGNFNPYITKKVSMYVDTSLMIETISENYKQFQEYIRKISNVHQGLLYSMRNKNFKFEGEFDHSQYISQETHISPISADDLIQKYDTSSVISNSLNQSNIEKSVTINPVQTVKQSQIKKPKNTSKENTEYYEKADHVISEGKLYIYFILNCQSIFNEDIIWLLSQFQ